LASKVQRTTLGIRRFELQNLQNAGKESYETTSGKFVKKGSKEWNSWGVNKHTGRQRTKDARINPWPGKTCISATKEKGS